MKQNKALKLSYAAGFIDGEGCIAITKYKKPIAKSPSYAISVTFGQKDGDVVDWFIGNFGGYSHTVKRDGSYIWRTSDRKAYEILKQIEPFLRYKRPQAQLAIRFYERSIIGNEKRRYLQLSEHEVQQREQIFKEMKRLKTVFAPIKARVQV